MKLHKFARQSEYPRDVLWRQFRFKPDFENLYMPYSIRDLLLITFLGI